jgi:hypothetical protein
VITLLLAIPAAVPLDPSKSEVNSHRSLHDTGRACAGRGAESCTRLSHDGCASISGRGAGQTRIWIDLYDAISQLRIDVPEIRAIENVIDFPSQLNLALLTQLDVL